MDPDELNNEDRTYLIAAMYRIVGQLERKVDALRETDREAVRLAHDDLSRRLEGFPQQYATKAEMEQAATALRRLETSAVSREVYEQRHNSVSEEIDAIQKDFLPRSVFETFLATYALDQERAVVDRRNVVESLAGATNQVRDQILSERGEYITQESYDQQHRSMVSQVEAVQAWQYKLVGGLVFATFLAPLISGLIVYIFSKELF